MDPASLEEKMAQFHEFFTIKHTLSVNMIPLGQDYDLPHVSRLVDQMPYAFQIAAQMSAVDTQALRPLRNLGEHAKDLADFLNQQNKKIDLMMSFILQQQDQPEHRYQSIEFGGGGLVLSSDKPFAEGEYAELKIFLSAEAAGVYCIGEVVESKQCENGFQISLLYSRIREEDQELLVRASLHQQTLQLRARAKQQNETN